MQANIFQIIYKVIMQRYLTTLARILLAQIFLLQIIMLIYGFFNNPNGYLEYQMG